MIIPKEMTAAYRKRTATIPHGTLNPMPRRDYRPKVSAEDVPLKIVFKAAYDLLYGVTAANAKKKEWLAVVMRVDKSHGDYHEFKARIPEIDAALPEPIEWIPPGVTSCSHLLIDAHRTYTGTSKVAPVIGQIVVVRPPEDLAMAPGVLVSVTDIFAQQGVKSSDTSSGAKDAASNAAAAFQVPPTAGDPVGSNLKNPSTQIPVGAQFGQAMAY